LCQRDPTRYAELHLRAAKRFERGNNVEEAVYHYLAGEDYSDAAVLMERVTMEWFTRGRVETLLRWAEALPEGARDQAPRLSLYQSMVLTDRYDYERARQALVRAESGFVARRDTARLALVHSQRATLVLFEGRYEDAIAEARTALDMLGQNEMAKQAEAQRLIGRAYIGLGRLVEGVATLQDALALYRQVGSPYDVVNLLQDLTLAFTSQGRFDEAAAARRGGVLWLQAAISEGVASIYRNIGVYERAESFYNAAWQIAQENEPGLAIYVLAGRADMYRWQGEHARALAVLGQARRLASEKGLDFEECGLLPVAEGIALVESGEVEKGLRFLSEAVHFLAGDKPQAVAELRRAVDLADEIGTDQFAVVEGQHAEELLRLGVAEGVTACRVIAEKIGHLRAFGEELVQGGVGAEGGAASSLEVYAFGEGRVVRNGRPVSSSEWQAAMAKELFFYILMHGPLERDAIGVVFWPELSAKKMTYSFHTTLHRMRRAVGADAVVMEGGQYRLGDVDYRFDVEEFEALVERARLLPPQDWQAGDLWQRAVALYQGDFLPEVERVWCVPKREALREMYIEALIGMGRCHEARREFAGAIGWYRRALGVDELREDVHRRLMHCHAEVGRRSEALAQYHRCQEILRRELNVEPSIETKRLYERIARESPD
jgi:DNA-binding SARP family transcriptional activator